MDRNDSDLAELGAEQYQDELEALLRCKHGMQDDNDVALLARALNIRDERFTQEQHNDR